MPTETLPPPPVCLQPGATDHGEGLVTFALYAPGKRSVHLIGSFNRWNSRADPLQETDKGLWWIEKRLPPGEHSYQFVVDRETVLCDPYARVINTLRGCPPPCAVVGVGRTPYRWKHDAWQRPAYKDLIIYEILIADFAPGGGFRGVKGRLPYLKDLGINAIELTPVSTAMNGEGWGYDPTFFFAVSDELGTSDDLKELIDTAHAWGIAVLLDMVLAHTGKTHPFLQLYPIDESPWYGRGLGEPNRFGFPTLDYSKKAAQDFAREVIRYWLREFHFDGVRLDYLLGIGARGEEGLPVLARCVREANPEAYLIGEYSPEAPGMMSAAGYDGSWHVITRYALIALLRQGRLDEHDWNEFDKVTRYFDPRAHGYDTVYRAINFIESHDEERIIYDTRVVGLSEEEAYRKSALGASVLFTLPGQPMLYHGQEWGEDTRKKMGTNPLHWERFSTQAGRGLHEHYRKLCILRGLYPALRSENYAVEALYPEQKCIVYRRWTREGSKAVVAVNFSPEPRSIVVPLPAKGRWREALEDEVFDAGGLCTVMIPRSAARLFVQV
ncbi:MAG: alpha amylase C-terminal domain-containing protein [Alphaproteobacteria bacterium]|uniref:1,4-alpha-glucan branching enzyme n=1 Tax=Candidatus Nitrobium versatile TaxID=2884831 RepID=A0A953J827_9BACT|nr:alpha amylase C-terminal domain-containing protein [Candidatus Nitrobium versatile]